MQVRRFFKSVGSHFIDDNVQDSGAMMAYYAVMALFPMMIFVLSLALLVIPSDTVRQGLAMVTETMPLSVRDVIASRVDALIKASGAGFAIFGVVAALWSASRGAVSLMAALNTVYNKKETRTWIRRQLIAIAVTCVVALLAVVALALLVAGPYVGAWLQARYDLGAQFDTAWTVGRWVGAGLLVMFVWAIAYKYLPNTDAPFRVFTPGAVIGVLLWLGISALFGLYLSHFNSYEATYGTLGGAIIFLTWLWLSSVAMLTGAEINDVLADLRKHQDTGAAQLADPGEKGSHVDLRKASAQAQHA
ncbi:MAG: YihY/virulence factor BrkB family protein [Deltaproteobacteria bacterium]|nr:YihY/virulence factor BrkB family protein [Deltaproteobacteria bacterium]